MISHNIFRSISAAAGITALIISIATGTEGAGLVGSYYASMDMSGLPILTRTDAQILFNWGSNAPATGVPTDKFSVRWVGQVIPRTSGIYTFHVNSDNGRRLWIGDQLLIDKWRDDWNIDYLGSITVEAGRSYNICLEYFENTGAAGITLEWEGPDQPREIIPSSQLRPIPITDQPLFINLPSVNFSGNIPSKNSLGEYIDLPDIIAGAPLTIEAWVKPEKPTDIGSRIFDLGTSYGINNLILGYRGNTGRLNIDAFNNGTSLGYAVAPLASPPGSWQHVAGIWTNTQAILMINGTAVASTTLAAPPATGNRINCWIGRSNYGNDLYFRGQMRNIRIWNTARTPADIRSTMTSQLNQTTPGLVAWYSTINTNGTSLTQASGALGHAILMNGTGFAGVTAISTHESAHPFADIVSFDPDTSPGVTADYPYLATIKISPSSSGSLSLQESAMGALTASEVGTWTLNSHGLEAMKSALRDITFTPSVGFLGQVAVDLSITDDHAPMAASGKIEIVVRNPLQSNGAGLTAAYFPGDQFSGRPIQQIDPSVNFTWPSVPLENISSDHFSVRWQGKIEMPFDEATTLILTADDGIRTWLDGQLIVNDWTDHGAKEYRHVIPANSGDMHNLRIDYYECTGAAQIKLEWESAHIPRQAIPYKLLYPEPAMTLPALTEGTGLSAAYFPNRNLQGTPYRRRDSHIKFPWNGGIPAPCTPKELFSVQWTGFIQTRYNEEYTLTFTSDDGIRVWLDGNQIINNWTLHGTTENSFKFTAKAGKKQSIKIEYFQNLGGSIAKMEWASNMEGRCLVPESCLYPDDINIDIPLSSTVSPSFIEGICGPGIDITATPSSIMRLGATRFCINIPLDSEHSVPVTVNGGTSQSQGAISWKTTPLCGASTIVIRPGDSLLFEANITGTWQINRNCGEWKPSTSLPANHKIPLLFSEPGLYQIIHQDILGNPIANINIQVPGASLGDQNIACETFFRRIKDISLSNAGDDGYISIVPDDNWVEVGASSLPIGSPTTMKRLTIRPLLNRSTGLSARIGGVAGPVLAHQKVTPFEMYTTAEKMMELIDIYDDKSSLCQAKLVMTPLIHGIDVHMYAFVSGVTFEDSTTDKIFSTENFVEENPGIGIYTYQLIRAPGIKTGACHAWEASQSAVPVTPGR